jgi:hypothetical protein
LALLASSRQLLDMLKTLAQTIFYLDRRCPSAPASLVRMKIESSYGL